ncbi:MAG: hypothetical protein AB1430_08120 [Pseudomonadota bacterium]
MNRPRSPFFAGVWAGCTPLLLWALHFAFCYVVTAVGCRAWMQAAEASLTPLQLRGLMAAGTALALTLGLWLLHRACGATRHERAGLLPRVRLASAALALVAIAWTGLPLALLPVCTAG